MINLYRPDQAVKLCVIPSVGWRIHHRHRSQTGSSGEQVSSLITPVYCVRNYWGGEVSHQVVKRLVEHHEVVTYTPISLDRLPGEGQPTPQPDGPNDVRFFRLHEVGPSVLLTGDDVRQQLAKITEIHNREHGRRVHLDNKLAPLYPPNECSRCVRGPHDLDPMEVVITRTERDIEFSDLPQEWDYALYPALAHARITAAGVPAQVKTGGEV
ncbi:MULTISPECIES: hypothetical protein [unclassified Streptomyces]|uniref:hypothetical protein n=1 Tax=unclassified Streptomyces TaxID=2593676 RepID=UPI00226F2301|nr:MULTISPECIES: hypothetical protein [unclassified Streptomyces]MCY0924212.1 hypothetical protein [Streptomyces sp. H27-G5]MCY0963248.1 hypothetical protein [Streptomyces sp. H27-H5]